MYIGEMEMAREVKKQGNKDLIARAQSNPDKIVHKRSGAVSKAERELIARYKADRKINGVIDNTLESVISDCIYDIKEAVDNMINYGDSKVYRVIPKELDEKTRAYGLFAQEYFGKEIEEMKGTPVFIIPSTYKMCSKCGNYKSPDDFYVSNSDCTRSTTIMCKKCCNAMFKEYYKKYGIKEALIVMCQKLDVVVINSVLESYIKKYDTPEGKNDILKDTFFGKFIGDLNIYLSNSNIEDEDKVFCKTNLHGEPFREIIPKNEQEQIYDDVFASDNDDDDLDLSSTYQPISKLRKKWGNMEKQDLYWLEDKYNEWYDKCEIEGLAREKLVIQLCYEELDIVRTRERGGAVKDKVKSFQSLMKDSDLTPKKQVSASTTESQFTSLGAFIKAAEVKGPIISKNRAFRDVDNFEKIWKSIAGAISRTLGKENFYTENFNKNYKKYTVAFTNPDENTEEDKKEDYIDSGDLDEKD